MVIHFLACRVMSRALLALKVGQTNQRSGQLKIVPQKRPRRIEKINLAIQTLCIVNYHVINRAGVKMVVVRQGFGIIKTALLR